MTKHAIIFDMDGVIVDTEFLDYKIQRTFIAQENGEETPDPSADHSCLIGKSYDDLYLTMKKFLKKDYLLDDLKEKFDDFNSKMYQNADYRGLFREDILSILNYARENGILVAVASSSEYDHIVEVLEACGIKGYFNVIYSGEFVKESKPNPEIYRNTLKKLGVAPEMAVAIEDSYYGITASKSAGIKTIAYKESRIPIDQSGADYIGENMIEIKEIIREIFGC